MEAVLPLTKTIVPDKAEVLVFRTSVQSEAEARCLAPGLDALAGPRAWNFALDDCDRVLRVMAPAISVQKVIHLLSSNGFWCEELED